MDVVLFYPTTIADRCPIHILNYPLQTRADSLLAKELDEDTAHMSRNDKIRIAVERVADVFRKKPAAAFNTKRATGRIEHGLVCNARQDDYTATMDMPEPIGGEGSAPSPGFHIRMGLVGCVAVGIKLTAAREGVDIGVIDVDVEMDFDDAAMIGVSDNSAAPLETRITIAIESAAPWEEVTAMVGRALERDPYFIAFRDAQPMKTKLVPARN